jgi:hypothetical protein
LAADIRGRGHVLIRQEAFGPSSITAFISGFDIKCTARRSMLAPEAGVAFGAETMPAYFHYWKTNIIISNGLTPHGAVIYFI